MTESWKEDCKCYGIFSESDLKRIEETASCAISIHSVFLTIRELKYLTPYKRFLIHEYGNVILIYLATLFLNVFAIALALNRKFFLKDTGRKLSHLDNQLHVGHGDLPAPSFEEEDDHHVA